MQVFPLEVVRRRMQTMAADSLSRKAGMVVLRQAVMDIWARERLRGFYAGMLPNTVQARPSPSLASLQRASEAGAQGCHEVHGRAARLLAKLRN